jgi:hypothetical protein
MSRRPVRLVLIAVGLLATAGVGYRAWLLERASSSLAAARVASDRTAAESLEAVSNLRAAMHAQVAVGQDAAPWVDRAGQLLDTLRQRVLALDQALAEYKGSMAESLDGLDQLANLEARARDHLAGGEMLLAADLVFTEGRTLLDAVRRQIAAAQTALDREQSRRAEAMRFEQMALAAGAVGAWLLVALLLAPAGPASAGAHRPAASALSGSTASSAASPSAASASSPASPSASASSAARPSASPAAVSSASSVALSAIAEICSDLAALSDIGALTGALARAADALDATGLIVWIASNDGSHLSAVAAHGYDPRLVKRIGTITREANNLTAAAFREATVKIGALQPSRPGALAAALCGPSGPVGVLAVELRPGVPADASRAAVMSILAAQLSTLALPVPASDRLGAESSGPPPGSPPGVSQPGGVAAPGSPPGVSQPGGVAAPGSPPGVSQPGGLTARARTGSA